jgi:hypothetical protein
MKRLLTVGIMLMFLPLALSISVASEERENATNNLTLPENISSVNTNVDTIQNISLNIILIKNMINIIMPQNMTNATEAIMELQNITSSSL